MGKVPVATFPALSVAVQVAVVVPTGRTLPLAGVQIRFARPLMAPSALAV